MFQIGTVVFPNSRDSSELAIQLQVLQNKRQKNPPTHVHWACFRQLDFTQDSSTQLYIFGFLQLFSVRDWFHGTAGFVWEISGNMVLLERIRSVRSGISTGQSKQISSQTVQMIARHIQGQTWAEFKAPTTKMFRFLCNRLNKTFSSSDCSLGVSERDARQPESQFALRLFGTGLVCELRMLWPGVEPRSESLSERGWQDEVMHRVGQAKGLHHTQMLLSEYISIWVGNEQNKRHLTWPGQEVSVVLNRSALRNFYREHCQQKLLLCNWNCFWLQITWERRNT